jgi:hypothetical protein
MRVAICTLGRKSKGNNQDQHNQYEKPFHFNLHNAAPKWVGKRIGNFGQLLSTLHEANIG